MASGSSHSSMLYSPQTVARAARALRCAPFRRLLFATMVQQSVALSAIAGNAGVQAQYTIKPLSELAAESELLWLIQVGLLRREVDGQGLTDSFRVTPLGRQLVQTWQSSEQSDPSWRDRLQNTITRWFRFNL